MRDVPKVLKAVNSKLYNQLYGVAISMRDNPTVAEDILWQVLKNKALGYKFRRQHIIDRFIVDFYCVKAGLVIEADGTVHKYQEERDEERDNILKSLGCIVLRFSNDEVENNLKNVVEEINKALST